MLYFTDIFSDIVLPESSAMIYAAILLALSAMFAAAVAVVFILRNKIKFQKEIATIFDELPINLAIVDENGNMSFVHSKNKKYAELKKLKELGETEAWLFRNALKEISDTAQETVKFEYDSLSMAGHHFNAAVKAMPEGIFGPKRFLMMSLDDTEKHGSNRRLNMLHEREKIYRIALQMIAQDKKFYEFIEWLLENLVEWLDADLAVVHRFDHDTGEIVPVASHSKSNTQINYGKFDKNSPLYRKLANQEIVIYQRGIHNPDMRNIEEYLKDQNVESCLLFGVMSKKNMAGAIGVYYLGRHHDFSDDDFCAVSNVAKISQIAYDRGKYVEHLETSESEKAMVINTIDIPLAIFDSEGKLKSLNAACARLINKTPEQIKSCAEFFPACGKINGNPDCSVNIVLETKRGLRKTNKYNGRIYEHTYTPIFDSVGNVSNIIMAAYDISDADSKIEDFTPDK